MSSETYSAAEITLVADEVDHAHAICTRKENQTYTENLVPRWHRIIGWALREAAARCSADSVEDLLTEVIAHLGASIIQSIPTDDQIIMDHVRTAHELAQAARRQLKVPA